MTIPVPHPKQLVYALKATNQAQGSKTQHKYRSRIEPSIYQVSKHKPGNHHGSKDIPRTYHQQAGQGIFIHVLQSNTELFSHST